MMLTYKITFFNLLMIMHEYISHIFFVIKKKINYYLLRYDFCLMISMSDSHIYDNLNLDSLMSFQKYPFLIICNCCSFIILKQMIFIFLSNFILVQY